jgi:Holliday junction resolvase
MSFKEKTSSKKGSYGEELVKNFLEQKGFVVYAPLTDAPHSFDFLCMSGDKKDFFAVEVKSFARRLKYKDVGIDQRHYEAYLHFKKKSGFKVFIMFVCHIQKAVFMASLDKLQQEYIDKKNRKTYPCFENNKGNRKRVYFHFDTMSKVATLTEQQARKLAELSNINPIYK